MALRVREQRKRDAAWDLERWLDRPAPRLLDPRQHGVKVVHADVERHVAGTFGRPADATVDATVTRRVDHGVVHRSVGRSQRPAERPRVEAAKGVCVASQDLEVDHRVLGCVLHDGSMRHGI